MLDDKQGKNKKFFKCGKNREKPGRVLPHGANLTTRSTENAKRMAGIDEVWTVPLPPPAFPTTHNTSLVMVSSFHSKTVMSSRIYGNDGYLITIVRRKDEDGGSPAKIHETMRKGNSWVGGSPERD